MAERSAKWRNANDMVQVNTAIPRDLRDSFDAATQTCGMTRRSALLDLMRGFVNTVERSKRAPILKAPVFGVGVTVTLTKAEG